MNTRNGKKCIRLERELLSMKKSPPSGISCSAIDDSDNRILSASIVGTTGSPYEKGVFKLEITITERYPFEPPQVRFTTRIYHPNVDTEGRICLDLLKMPPHGGWKPTVTIESLLVAIQYLMANPNPEDPLMPDIAYKYKYNKDLFIQEAAELTGKYASFGAVAYSSSNNPHMIESDKGNKRKSEENLQDGGNVKKPCKPSN